MTSNRYTTWALRVLLVAAMAGLWELLSGGLGGGLSVMDPLFFSRPSAIVVDLLDGFASGDLVPHLVFTLEGAFSGLILGIVTGIVVGFAFAYIRWLRILFDPFMVAFNSLPRPALGPILIIIFGLGLTSKVFLSWSVVFFVVFYNTYAGVASVDDDVVRAIRVMGAKRRQILRLVVVPSVLSWVFAALRVAVSFSLIGAIVGEFVGSTRGLGYEMMIAQGVLNTKRAYSILVLLMLIGVTLTEASKQVEDRLLRWKPTEGRL